MCDQHRAVSIVMVEDDEGHARLIEKNLRRAGVYNEIIGFDNGTAALCSFCWAAMPKAMQTAVRGWSCSISIFRT